MKIKSPSSDALYVLKTKSRDIDFKYSGIETELYLGLKEDYDAEETPIDASGKVSKTFDKVGIYYWTLANKGVKAPTRKRNLSPSRPQALHRGQCYTKLR